MAITSWKQLTVSMTVKSFIYNFIENIWYIWIRRIYFMLLSTTKFQITMLMNEKWYFDHSYWLLKSFIFLLKKLKDRVRFDTGVNIDVLLP